MTDPAGFAPDPLDDLLQPPPGDGGDALRRRLRDRTTRALRRGRRWRTVAWAAALAACFAGGALTVSWLGPRQTERVVVIRRQPESPPPTSSAPVPPATAAALENQAFDADRGRPELYRKAADQYLHDDADPASALRCYGAALDGAADKDLAVSPDDDYLLMVVKEARQREKSNAKKHG